MHTDEIYSDWTSVIELWWSWWSGPTSASTWTACCLNVKCGVRFKSPLQVWYCQWSAVWFLPLRMARSGAIALWCQTVMSRVQGNTINTMARISLLFGISRIGYLARHYLDEKHRHVDFMQFCHKDLYFHRCSHINTTLFSLKKTLQKRVVKLIMVLSTYGC